MIIPRTTETPPCPEPPGARSGTNASEDDPRAPGARGARPGVRRAPADPVKALMHRHRELCERAVDPLEIAAGLEAHGVTDRTAARFRHRDVFSLAEELYARVPRADRHTRVGQGAAVEDAARAAPRGYLDLLPGAACAAAVAGVELVAGAGQAVRLGVGVAGTAVVAVALRMCLRRGPLSLRGGSAGTAPLWTCWLLGYLLFGDALLGRLAEGRVEELVAAHRASAAPGAAALALAVAPAAWCARWFAVRARRRLAVSRGPEDFSTRIRPLLPTAVGLFLLALVGLLAAAWAALHVGGAGGSYGTGSPGTPGSYGSLPGPDEAVALACAAALGVLLFTARLLAVHGRPSAAASGLAAACAVEATALGTVVAARLPGCGALGRPVEAVVGAYGAGAVPLAAGAAAALALLAHATVALSRVSAHATLPPLTAMSAR